MSQATPSKLELQLNSLKQKRIPSEQLFENQREVVIVHKGRDYRLRLTHSGKLILTA